MAEELEIKVTANTGAAVSELKKAETAVDGVKKKTKELDDAGKKAGDSVGQAVSKQVSTFTQLAEGIGKLTMIFGLAVAAGKALAAGIDAMSASFDKAAAAENAAHARKIQFNKAMALAKQGTIELGASTEAMLKNYDAYVAKMSPATKAIQDQTRALNEYKMALDQIAADINKANAGKGFTILSPEDAAEQQKAFEALATGLEAALKKAFEVGGAEEREAWVAANEKAVEEVIKTYEKYGLEVPKHLKEAMAARGADVDGTKAWVAAQVAEYQKLEEAVKRQRAAEDAANNRTSKAPEEFRQIQQEAFGAAVALGEMGTSLDRVAEAVVATGGTMTVGSPIWIQIAQATAEATAELEKYIDATKRLRDGQMEVLNIAQGWKDYVVGLHEAYKDGTTSLGTYINLLSQFATQLQTTFAGATGEAKKGLEDMLDIIRTLIATAGADPGGRYDPSMVGQLERAFNDAKGKK